jgi:hypothetical protein
LFKVVGPNVVPELAEESLVGVVVSACLGIGDLKIGAELRRDAEKEIAKSDQ